MNVKESFYRILNFHHKSNRSKEVIASQMMASNLLYWKKCMVVKLDNKLVLIIPKCNILLVFSKILGIRLFKINDHLMKIINVLLLHKIRR